MNRRDILRASAPTALISIAGCTSVLSTNSSSKGCGGDNNYDKLTIKLQSQNEPQSNSTVIINYGELDSAVKKVVNKSINNGKIKQCHKFKGSKSDIQKFWTVISKKWDTADGKKSQKLKHTFLKKDGKYYGIELILLDTFRVDSIQE